MSDRPTERAMKAAVDMEVHAALSTQTIAKAEALDGHFPGHDDLVAALRLAEAALMHSKPRMAHYAEAIDRHNDALTAVKNALAKAEG